ncbi:MAG: ATPase [Spirochaetaceae bacterium]|nr:ATPase [Spirochaetaceae bacterium]
MIVPMKKVSLIVLKNERKVALENLRKAGVMHLETVLGNSKELASLKADFSSFERASLALDEIKAPKKKGGSSADLDKLEVQKHVDEINLLLDNKKKSEEVIIKNNRELERFTKWGDVNPDDFNFLKDKELDLYLYEIPVSKYYDIPEDVHTIVVNQDKNICRCIAYSADNSQLKMPAEARLVSLPEKSTKILKEEVASAKNDIVDINKKLNTFVGFKDSIKKSMKQLEKEIEFENVYSGMGKEEGETGTALAWISGFVPEPELASLKKVAAENSWAIYADDPTEEDNVPTKLKNSKAVQILYPVMDFLGTVPGYHEFDISAWFLIFLVIFFAMIFGDAGYGMLMLVIGLILAAKSKITKKEVPPAMILLIVWALATVVWGAVNCSWFGIEAEKLPVCLQNLALPVFAPGNPERDMNLQIFCFILALVQMSIGHVIALLRNIKEKSLKLLADIGSLSILWGMFYVVLMLIVSAEKFPMHNAVLFMIGGGFALSFVFSNYEGSIGKSILESLKNIISVLLGVINFFSDIVSYIRLWAVALAGSAIAQTVNQMAGPMLGNFLIFFGILLLVFGHGLNMVLNALSVIVHGVRLNTLEFTSHVGMAWAGYKYKPFSE